MRAKDILREASRVVDDEEIKLARKPKYEILTFKASELASKEIQIEELKTQFSDLRPTIRTRDRDKEKQIMQQYLQRS